MIAFDVPVDPDSPTAREWLARELAKGEYRAAKPTALDRAAQAFWDWLNDLGRPVAPDGPPIGILGLVIVVAVLVAIGFLVWGAPRLRRRSAVGAAGELFGDGDLRSAARLRAASEEAARAGDWALAIAERFRAIARSLADRTVITVLPGSTARAVAGRAGAVFPTLADVLVRGAAHFDDVRYLGGAGDEAAYRALERLDRELRGARPVLDAADALGPVAPR